MLRADALMPSCADGSIKLTDSESGGLVGQDYGLEYNISASKTCRVMWLKALEADSSTGCSGGLCKRQFRGRDKSVAVNFNYDPVHVEIGTW
jgi:hypothetical protein